MKLRRVFRENSLSLVMFGLFVISLLGQTVTGFNAYNQEQKNHHQPGVTSGEYVKSGHFIEAVFENWESEFLQMSVYVLLTSFLYQKGSAESKDPDKKDGVDEEPNESDFTDQTPWPVRQGGLSEKIYENSLSTALFLLFLISFILHAIGGSIEYNEEQLAHGGKPVSAIQYVQTSQFWFESFQNWQSEFLSIGAVVVLSIYLRQKGSPESKPVAASNEETGKP